MARSIVDYALSHGISSARVGISQRRRHISALARAYQEACAALECGGEAVCFFEHAAASTGPAELMEPLVKAIRDGGPIDAHIRAFMACAMPDGDSVLELPRWHAVLTWAIEHVALEVVSIGADPHQALDAKHRALNGVLNAPTPFIAGEAFRRFAVTAQQHVASLFSHRDQKIARAVCRFIDERGPAQVTVHDVAHALQLSSGHLNRVIRRTTGSTLEELLVRRRVELAKRLLLDTRLNVAQVAERCGFCNSAYFASVFKKYVQRTPSEFARSPQTRADDGRAETLPLALTDSAVPLATASPITTRTG
jgi:AraC-like DNA-binding protein